MIRLRSFFVAIALVFALGLYVGGEINEYSKNFWSSVKLNTE